MKVPAKVNGEYPIHFVVRVESIRSGGPDEQYVTRVTGEKYYTHRYKTRGRQFKTAAAAQVVADALQLNNRSVIFTVTTWQSGSVAS